MASDLKAISVAMTWKYNREIGILGALKKIKKKYPFVSLSYGVVEGTEETPRCRYYFWE